MKRQGSGWKGESRRHSLARKGIKTMDTSKSSNGLLKEYKDNQDTMVEKINQLMKDSPYIVDKMKIHSKEFSKITKIPFIDAYTITFSRKDKIRINNQDEKEIEKILKNNFKYVESWGILFERQLAFFIWVN